MKILRSLSYRTLLVTVLCSTVPPCDGQTGAVGGDGADRPRGRVVLAVQIVGADVAAMEATDVAAPELPPRVMDRLRQILRYRSYRLLARADFAVREGVDASYDVGEGFEIAFEPQDTEHPGRIRARAFRLARWTANGEPQTLVDTDLVLEVGRPLILGLSKSETSHQALMVVLEVSDPDGSRS